MQEEWRPIEGFPLYSVSNLGQVRRGFGKPVQVHTNQQGIAYISLMKGEEQFHRGLARLVAKAFLEQKYAAFDTPINLDGNRLNCAVDNLVWRPRWFAITYHAQFKARYHDHTDQDIIDMETGFLYNGSWDVVTSLGLLERDVMLAIDNNTVVWPTYQRFRIDD